MPFTELEFFENFRAYNTALWPAIVLVFQLLSGRRTV